MITDINFVRQNLSEISPLANKYSKGYGVIFAGSYKMAGAAVLCGKACLKSGAGIIRLVVDERIYPICASSLLEAVYSFDDEEIDLEKAKAVAFGCGSSQSEKAEKTLLKLIRECKKPLVIDADGINILSHHIDVLNEKNCPVVLTPHEGEFARLSGLSVDFIRANREKSAEDFARKYGVILLLKGKDTVITDGERTYINPTGSPALATAGSGDVLTGIITAFLTNGIKPFEAAVSGAYIHGLSGEIAEKNLGARSVIASDIIEYLSDAFKEC